MKQNKHQKPSIWTERFLRETYAEKTTRRDLQGGFQAIIVPI